MFKSKKAFSQLSNSNLISSTSLREKNLWALRVCSQRRIEFFANWLVENEIVSKVPETLRLLKLFSVLFVLEIQFIIRINKLNEINLGAKMKQLLCNFLNYFENIIIEQFESQALELSNSASCKRMT